MKACEEGRIEPMIFILSQRGIAWSRIEEGIMAGNSEYHETGGSMCWTDALLAKYVDKFDILPSNEFIVQVSKFSLVEFQRKLDELQQCLSL
mmetsp:Transcript_37150/g.42389  ORF Transcript_37150/g.42389 Transcript_37150/m.42389 type:complete len:92 (-) Transcript_37150:193-468(-)